MDGLIVASTLCFKLGANKGVKLAGELLVVGLHEGVLLEGRDVGYFVGLITGDLVGLRVGYEVGDLDGVMLGVEDG